MYIIYNSGELISIITYKILLLSFLYVKHGKLAESRINICINIFAHVYK